MYETHFKYVIMSSTNSFFWNNNTNLIQDILLRTQILKLISVAFHTVPCTERVWDIWKNKPLCVSRFYIMAYHKTVNKRGNSRDGCGLHPGGMSAGVTLQSALRLASKHLSSPARASHIVTSHFLFFRVINTDLHVNKDTWHEHRKCEHSISTKIELRN